ncbi:Cthe_2314 family HEPN domain-containing protein [Marinicrinis lubricantis]|uniref:Cthe_2314 family HEPN domain-containing protein n=1 Tax=Marinicrinis lubricantis TaxID=2086470 RepID=A0ABW1IUR5_9BACL
MLRKLFNEPRRKDAGSLQKAHDAITDYIRLMDQRKSDDYKLNFWAKGFLDSLNELEQSVYCSQKYAALIHKTIEEQMNAEELEQYHLFLYFYKNAFIRVFSILDKLGYFINELLSVRTEKIKPKFSYYTVLRVMHEKQIHPQFEQKLFDLKVKYKEPMHRLRQKRNIEIHYMNVELVDDLYASGRTHSTDNSIENPALIMKDLQQAYEMVIQSVEIVFQYAKRMLT